MRKIIYFLVSVFLITSAFGEENIEENFLNFKKSIEDFNKSLENVNLSFENYNNWYKDFKPKIDDFKKSVIEYKDKEFFKNLSGAIDKFSLVWTLLKQANDAYLEYTEFITGSSDVGYAHKWKQVYNLKMNEAKETFKDAIDTFNKAYSLFLEEK